MTSMIRRLKERFYPSTGHTVSIIGLSGSGKTTMLYYLRLGEIVQTISTIGFNVETIDITTSSGKPFRMTGWDVGTGCGISYLFGLLRVYIESSEALIWMIDCSCRDEDWISESVDSLQRILSDLDSGNTSLVSKLPILILANKSDKPGAMSLDEVRIKFSKVVSGRLSAIYKTCFIAGSNGTINIAQSGLPEAFDWLALAIDIMKPGKPIDAAQKELAPIIVPLDPRSQATIMQKLDSWLTRIESDVGVDQFLDKFRAFSLDSWDHYTHIRVAYVLLTKYGRQEGKVLIFKGLESYIANSQQTQGKSFHITMSYFWIQIVHFGICNMPSANTNIAAAPNTHIRSPKNAPTEPDLPSPDDFAHFLLINPHVADGNLWTDYYSRDVMMTPAAKAEMVLPDKKPLPNLVIRDAIKSFSSKK